MNNIKNTFIYILLLGASLLACDDVVDVNLEEGRPLLVVDAWINNKPETQTILLSRAQPYFDASEPTGESGAAITVTDSDGKEYVFQENENIAGTYEWTPEEGEVLGQVGLSFELSIAFAGNVYISTSSMKRVPPVDTVVYRFEEEGFEYDEGYYAQFVASDPEGEGDTYWIKSYKNGDFLNRPSEINISYDSGFEGWDGLTFLEPIQDAVNPIEDDEYVPFVQNDSLYVEVHSLTQEAHLFLLVLYDQIDRDGSFAELFQPQMVNLESNITSSDPEESVLGFFSVSAVEGNGARLDTSLVPIEE